MAEQHDNVNTPNPGPQQWKPLTTIHDSGERQRYASGSLRDPSTGKIKWSRIVFGPMMRRWAQHLTSAEAKYPDVAPGVPNFMLIESEEERQRYRESAFRHFMSWVNGETDEDHAAAVFFNINGVEIIAEKQRAGQSLRSLPEPGADIVVQPKPPCRLCPQDKVWCWSCDDAKATQCEELAKLAQARRELEEHIRCQHNDKLQKVLERAKHDLTARMGRT